MTAVSAVVRRRSRAEAVLWLVVYLVAAAHCCCGTDFQSEFAASHLMGAESEIVGADLELVDEVVGRERVGN